MSFDQGFSNGWQGANLHGEEASQRISAAAAARQAEIGRHVAAQDRQERAQLRAVALELAVGRSGPHASPAEVLAVATDFFAFLDG